MTHRLTGPITGSNSSHRAHALRVALVLCILLTLPTLIGCDPEESDEQIIVTGSTTLLPIAEIAGEDYTEAHPGIKVLVSGLGSAAGIESVAAGSSDIGTSSRDLKDTEAGLGLYDTAVAMDAIAVIVNPENPIDSLTADQVRSIFKGEITNWSQVGGHDRRIGLVNRDEASGTREAFFKILMREEKFDPAAAVLPGTGQVRSVVGEAAGAIGYISYGFVNDDVKLIAVDGIRPSEETIKDGSYPIQRTLHFFTKGRPTGPTADFIEYIVSDEVQDGVVRDAGFTAIPRKG
ncbi:MAG: phosphate ABC transporter substrate-binding protein [Actinobacteria bacterium HGW-Actinobacteria-9]|nr:MAG: phosphate ABC transporter substrate-binding protein [Actinobacteria bacterium HGW-Actinobacteria-9]